MKKSARTMPTRAVDCNDEPRYFNGPLLINEPPLQVLPSLAVAIGLEEAIFVQQLHFYFCNPSYGRVVNGHRWIYKTHSEWAEVFPFLSERTIRRIIATLEDMHIIETCQPEGGISRRKYYRLNEAMLKRMLSGRLEMPRNHVERLSESCGQLVHMERPTGPLPNAEKTYKDYSQRRLEKTQALVSPEGSAGGFVDFSLDDQGGYPQDLAPVFPTTAKVRRGRKPDTRTKEEKLAAVEPPPGIPSQDEFDDFVSERELDFVTDTNTYEQLGKNKWHRWNGSTKRWEPIYNWRKFIVGLNRHMVKGAEKASQLRTVRA